MLSLKTRIIAGLALVSFYGFMIITLALALPGSDTTFQINGDRIQAQLPDGKSVIVTAFTNGESIQTADVSLLIEEPDVLPHYADLNTFFATLKNHLTSS